MRGFWDLARLGQDGWSCHRADPKTNRVVIANSSEIAGGPLMSAVTRRRHRIAMARAAASKYSASCAIVGSVVSQGSAIGGA